MFSQFACMRIGRRSRKIWIPLTAILCAGICGTGFWLAKRRSVSAAGATIGSVRLPFALPCAIASGDAQPFYAALRRSDRKAVIQMLADKRIRILRKDTPFSITPFSKVAAVAVRRDSRPVCYIPLDIVASLDSKAYK